MHSITAITIVINMTYEHPPWLRLSYLYVIYIYFSTFYLSLQRPPEGRYSLLHFTEDKTKAQKGEELANGNTGTGVHILDAKSSACSDIGMAFLCSQKGQAWGVHRPQELCEG